MSSWRKEGTELSPKEKQVPSFYEVSLGFWTKLQDESLEVLISYVYALIEGRIKGQYYCCFSIRKYTPVDSQYQVERLGEYSRSNFPSKASEVDPSQILS